MVVKLQAGTFYGVTARTVTAAGFRFTEKSYEPRISLPRHAHELAHYCFVLAGNYSEQLGTRISDRMPTALVFYPPDMSHAEKHYDGGRHFLIELEPWRVESIKDYGLAMRDPISLANTSSNSLAAKLYREFRMMDELSILALEGLAVELIVETSRNHTNQRERRPPRWLDDAKEILKANFSKPPNLDQLGQAVGIHPVHLVRVFRKFQKATVGEYVRQLRIEHARQKMLSSNDSLVEIALSCGFADHTHFSRSFKRVTGMTPSEFRRISPPR